VAAFVGTPPMNFFEGRIVEEGDGCFFVGQGIKLPLDGEFRRAAEHAASPEATLGIRPDGLYLRPGPYAREDMSIDVTVGVSEPLGSTMDLFAFTGEDHRLTARVVAEVIEMDTAATLYVDPGKMHLFDAGEYGVRLNADTPTAAAVTA